QAPSIVGAEGGHVALTSGYNIYVDHIEEGGGLNWQIFRKGNALVDPDTKEQLGFETVYLGDARAVRYGDPATIKIVRPKEEVYKGDKLFKMPDTDMNSFVPRAPESDIAGRIISAYNAIAELGPNSVVIINRGSDDGLAEGEVLAIYRPGTVVPAPASKKGDKPKPLLLPDERIGLLMVFRAFKRVSYAIIMKAERPVNVLDVVRTPTP
ncbi:MAG TPA: peptidoglycan-binding protein LysM, partial [Methylophilaceae bacterium]|nr:peptidoglycan-binding protein LysM [Methylophilaceae bacterium]